MNPTRLHESVAEAPVKNGDTYRVVVARPGQGSSGFYSEDLFRRDAHKIIAPGGQAFIGHNEDRSVKDLIGVYPNGSRWDEDEKAVVSELKVFKHWQEFVNEVFEHVGVSLYALGEADTDGNVTAFIEDAYNGADLVARPGLAGSRIEGLAEQLYEAAKALSSVEKPGVTSAQEIGKLSMEKDVEERFTALEALLQTLVAKEQDSKAEAAQAEADKDAGRKAVEAYDAAVIAIDAADLPEKVVESLRAQAKEGKDVTALIEQAVAIKEASEEAITARLGESAPGREFGGDKVTKFGAWS